MSTRRSFAAMIQAMEANALRTAVVARRLLAEHEDLPDLLGVRPQATGDTGELYLQSATVSDCSLWADRLDVDLTEDICASTVYPGQGDRHLCGSTTIDGVTVRVVSYDTLPAGEWEPVVRPFTSAETPAGGESA